MFTENQVRQFYVGTSTAADVFEPVEVDSSYAAQDLSGETVGACQFVLGPNKDEFYLSYKGPNDDGVQRSDLIKLCNIIDVRCTGAKDMKHKMKKVEVALVSGTTPIVGQDYILNVTIHNYMAPDYNTSKIKFGAARAVNTTASDLYKALALNLAKNFAREATKLIKITLKGDSNHTEITSKTDISSLSSVTATAIEIEEVEQPWRRGAAPQEFVNFEANPSTVYNATTNEDVVWGTVTDITASNSNAVVNSKKIADMEWFFHKERGDQYGETCWPYNLDTTYQVDATNAYGYSVIDIHYYFEGNSHNVGHSEKTLTIVFPGKSSHPDANAQTLIGSAYVPASGNDPAVDATGLYAWLEGTGVSIKFSANWDAA